MTTRHLIETIKRQEGYRQFPYTSTAGKLIVGYGRNLDDKGISEREAIYLMSIDLQELQENLIKALPEIEDYPVRVQEVLMNMGFQMGVAGLLKFKKTLKYIDNGNYEQAADEMLDSRWAKQKPERAKELSDIIRTTK